MNESNLAFVVYVLLILFLSIEFSSYIHYLGLAGS